MKERTRTWRLPPCPPYDVEGTESWLSDMALQGWRLEKYGIFFGVASFEKKTPAPLRYRLEAAPKQASDWDDNDGRPDDEALELNADYGWEYIARRGQFYIYCNETPGARELNTDPQVQALAIKTLQNRQLGNFCVTLFWWFLYPLLHVWQGFSLFLTIAEIGLPIVTLTIAIPLWMVIDSVFEIVHLQRLKKKLQAGTPLDHNKSWRRSRRSYFAKRILKFLMILLWIILLLQLWNDSIMETHKQKRSLYEKTLPFATMADFAEGVYEEMWEDIRYDYVMEWSNAIIISGIKWAEHATVRRPDGSLLQGGLYITYYDAGSEWLAKVLVAEYQRSDRAKAGKNYTPLNCPDFGLDSASAYIKEPYFPCVILRQDHTVVYAYFYQTGPGKEMSVEEWARILADSIR